MVTPRQHQEGAKTIGIFVRETLERAATYAEAIDALNTTHLIAPAYYIIAGTEKGEGAVVTRNRTTPDNIVDEGIWFVLHVLHLRCHTGFF